jgi:hypothetical protein
VHEKLADRFLAAIALTSSTSPAARWPRSQPTAASLPASASGRQHIVGVSKTAYVLATPGCLD